MDSPQTQPRVTVTVTRQVNASPEQVYDAWLDPASVRQWLFATPGGEIVRADIEAHPGGKFTITDRRGEQGDIEHTGEYIELDRPWRIVFEFAVPKLSTERTRVAVDIAPAGSGCEVTLTHMGVLPEWEERTQQGWGMLLGSLARVVEGQAKG